MSSNRGEQRLVINISEEYNCWQKDYSLKTNDRNEQKTNEKTEETE